VSETKHTPGPWQAEQDDVPYDGGFETWCVNADGAGICMMDCPKDDMEANARLIAAAPDLLEALEEVLGTGLNGGNNMRLAFMAASQQVLSDEALRDAEKSEMAVAKARAAIAKARG
jgi:hypothetical protein